LERWRKRLTLDDLRLAERYLKVEVNLLVRYMSECGEDNIAYLESASFPHVVPLNRLSDEFKPYSVEGTHYDKQKPVLVEVVKLMESPQTIIPSLVGITESNRFFDFFPHAVYFSARFSFVLLGSLKNGKSCLAGRAIARNENKLPRQVIQGASQVVNCIPSKQSNVVGHGDVINESDFMRSGFSIMLGADTVVIEKCKTCSVEIGDVLIGPFNFTPSGVDGGIVCHDD